MIISEKQIMQLMLIARSYIEQLNNGTMIDKMTGTKITELLYNITCQQSEELKVIQ